MLTPYVQSKFVEKVFTDEAGRQFKLTFLVTLINGEVKARLVSATPVAQPFEPSEVACLPVVISNKEVETEFVPTFTPVASPYFSLDYLISSQPTRAPSRF